jgi:alpha-L-fucosidase
MTKPAYRAVCLCIAPALLGQALDQPRPLPGPRPSAAAVEAWHARKFGMFIHFGLYSMLGGVWQGKQITNGYSEQILSHAPVPAAEYEALAAKFDPEKFDADAIAALAKDAGMKYVVITAKHHDGFNLFHTRLTNYNVVDASPYHQDVVRKLADACARHGLKFGVYYSSIDWHYPGATSYTDDNNNPIPKAHEDFNAGQLRELASGYGPLSEIWFDMGRPTPAQSRRFTETVHALQPDCMVSGRVFNHEGDFTVMGDNQIPKFVIDEPWQTPASIYSDTWGYRSWAKRTDLPGKIDEHILQLAQVVSRGGNYLLNIGPRGDGSVVEFEAAVLRGAGAWLKVNGEAIYGSEPQPFRELSFGYATVKPGKLYLLVREWPANGRLDLPGLENRIGRAYLLADPSRAPLGVDNRRGAKAVLTSQSAKPAPLSVVVAEYQGRLSVIPPVRTPDENGRLVLLEKDADHYLAYNGYGYYDRPAIYKEQWALAIRRPGKYQVEVIYKNSGAERKLDLVAGGRRFPVALPTSENGQVKAAVITLPASEYLPLKITPPEPFFKGEKLGVKIDRLELTRLP